MTNCKCKDDKCPELFKVQSNQEIDYEEAINPIDLLQLPVLIKSKNTEVKLDSTVEIFTSLINRDRENIGFASFSYEYILQRSTNGGNFTTLATMTPSQSLNVIPASGAGDSTYSGSLVTNLTWVDKPEIGCYIYRILIDKGPAQTFIIQAPDDLSRMIRTRSLNASVFTHQT
ncbi:hypothetical protein ACSVDA_23600 [Cytobacillus sp. Hm23]